VSAHPPQQRAIGNVQKRRAAYKKHGERVDEVTVGFGPVVPEEGGVGCEAELRAEGAGEPFVSLCWLAYGAFVFYQVELLKIPGYIALVVVIR
jgi:hypothetical protein